MSDYKKEFDKLILRFDKIKSDYLKSLNKLIKKERTNEFLYNFHCFEISMTAYKNTLEAIEKANINSEYINKYDEEKICEYIDFFKSETNKTLKKYLKIMKQFNKIDND